MFTSLFRYCLLGSWLLALPAVAQVPDPAQTDQPPPLDENFDQFGDVSDGGKSFCTQKVLYGTPTKLISIGYEAQLPYNQTTTRGPAAPIGITDVADSRVSRAQGLRLAFNAPVISRNSLILNLGLTYWNTGQRLTNTNRSPYFSLLNDDLRTMGVNATLFKPLDNKHFLLFQLNLDANGNYQSPSDLDRRHLTFSGTAIYGWKPNDNLQWGVGATRTYRAGQLLYIPVILYNRTFSPRWGCEVVFPARAEIRRNFGTTALLKIGYELEGNAYFLGKIENTDVYLRRGELKPRITYEQRLTGFAWATAQVGLRYNYRNATFKNQNPTGDRDGLLGSEPALFDNKLTNPMYVNLSLHLVSP
jgi:hypothetical protein